MGGERIPFPDRLVGWIDIARGIGEVILHTAFDAIHHEAHPAESTHFHEVTLENVDDLLPPEAA